MQTHRRCGAFRRWRASGRAARRARLSVALAVPTGPVGRRSHELTTVAHELRYTAKKNVGPQGSEHIDDLYACLESRWPRFA